tara:strand:+ start:451 stop:1128 length:678 start_codon:yes stop_codon:yes gene_type:complete
MAQETAYMPLWVGDYLADTQHLSTQEHGVYILLIMHYWRNGPLPDDKRKVLRISGVSRYTVCQPILEEFFTLSEGRWHHKRIDAELQKNKEYRELRAAAGKAGANARWKKSDSKRIANASDSQCERNGTHTHTHTQDKYIYHGRVFRLTSKSFSELLESLNTSENILVKEVQNADQYYDARIADGHEKDSFRFSSTAWFKLKSWLAKSVKNKKGDTPKPRISAAI